MERGVVNIFFFFPSERLKKKEGKGVKKKTQTIYR
jgi:hypothetical protein